MLYNYRNIVIKKEGKAVPQDTIAKVLQTEDEMKRRREQTAAYQESYNIPFVFIG